MHPYLWALAGPEAGTSDRNAGRHTLRFGCHTYQSPCQFLASRSGPPTPATRRRRSQRVHSAASHGPYRRPRSLDYLTSSARWFFSGPHTHMSACVLMTTTLPPLPGLVGSDLRARSSLALPAACNDMRTVHAPYVFLPVVVAPAPVNYLARSTPCIRQVRTAVLVLLLLLAFINYLITESKIAAVSAYII